MTEVEQRTESEELLDEESLAVLAILLAVSLEFGFGFAKTVDWWAGLIAGPAALAALVTLFRLRSTHARLVRVATWVVRTRSRRPAVDGSADVGRRLSRRTEGDEGTAAVDDQQERVAEEPPEAVVVRRPRHAHERERASDP